MEQNTKNKHRIQGECNQNFIKILISRMDRKQTGIYKKTEEKSESKSKAIEKAKHKLESCVFF